MMNLFARILSHAFAILVVVLLALGLMYRGDLFPDLELPEYLSLKATEEAAPPAEAEPEVVSTAPAPLPEPSVTATVPAAKTEQEPQAIPAEPEPVTETLAVEAPPPAEAEAVIEAPVAEAGLAAEPEPVMETPVAEAPPPAEAEAVIEAPVAEAGLAAEPEPVMETPVAEAPPPAEAEPMPAAVPDEPEPITEEPLTEPTAEIESAVETVPVPEAEPAEPEAGAIAPEIVPPPTGELGSADAEIATMRPYQLLAKAREAFWLRDYEVAEKHYQALTQREPDNPDGFGELGNMYFSQGRWEEAAAAYYEAGIRLISEGLLAHAGQMVEIIRGLNGTQADDLEGQIAAARSETP